MSYGNELTETQLADYSWRHSLWPELHQTKRLKASSVRIGANLRAPETLPKLLKAVVIAGCILIVWWVKYSLRLYHGIYFMVQGVPGCRKFKNTWSIGHYRITIHICLFTFIKEPALYIPYVRVESIQGYFLLRKYKFISHKLTGPNYFYCSFTVITE